MSVKRTFGAVRSVCKKDLEFGVALTRPTRTTVNLDHLEHNVKSFYSHLSKYSTKASLLPIIKANGYGHGALPLAVHLLKKDSVCKEMIAGVAVATLEEAIVLRRQLDAFDISCPLLLLLGMIPPGCEQELIEHRITPSVCDSDALKGCIRAAKEVDLPMKIHLKLDTGMHRVGVLPDGVHDMIKELSDASKDGHIVLNGVYTHLSKADESDKAYTMSQLEYFQTAIDSLKENELTPKFIHTMNSAGSVDFPQLQSDKLPFLKDLNLFRIGISLYGLYPSDQVQRSQVPLKSLMSWETKIGQVKHLTEGKKIGYGGTYTTTKDTTIAILPVGYADGYRRLLGRGGNGKEAYKVEIDGKLCPIVGNVCMDMMMVDVSDIDNPYEGQSVFLMGEKDNLGVNSPLHCDNMAERLSTINYEITCLVGERVPRFYISNNNLVALRTLHETVFLDNYLNKEK